MPKSGFPFSVVPEEICGLFEDVPVLMWSDEYNAYLALFESLAADLKPANILGWLLFKDVLDYWWQTLRLRRWSVAVLDNEWRRALPVVLRKIQAFNSNGAVFNSEALAVEYCKDLDVRNQVEDLLYDNGLNEHSVTAQAFMACVRTLQTIDRMDGRALKRRDQALVQLNANSATRHERAAAETAGNAIDRKQAIPAERSMRAAEPAIADDPPSLLAELFLEFSPDLQSPTDDLTFRRLAGLP